MTKNLNMKSQRLPRFPEYGTAIAYHSSCVFLLLRTNQGGNMSDDNGTASNMIWAVAMIIIVAIIAGALYYGGFLSGKTRQKIDVEVSAPAGQPANR